MQLDAKNTSAFVPSDIQETTCFVALKFDIKREGNNKKTEIMNKYYLLDLNNAGVEFVKFLTMSASVSKKSYISFEYFLSQFEEKKSRCSITELLVDEKKKYNIAFSYFVALEINCSAEKKNQYTEQERPLMFNNVVVSSSSQKPAMIVYNLIDSILFEVLEHGEKLQSYMQDNYSPLSADATVSFQNISELSDFSIDQSCVLSLESDHDSYACVLVNSKNDFSTATVNTTNTKKRKQTKTEIPVDNNKTVDVKSDKTKPEKKRKLVDGDDEKSEEVVVIKTEPVLDEAPASSSQQISQENKITLKEIQGMFDDVSDEKNDMQEFFEQLGRDSEYVANMIMLKDLEELF